MKIHTSKAGVSLTISRLFFWKLWDLCMSVCALSPSFRSKLFPKSSPNSMTGLALKKGQVSSLHRMSHLIDMCQLDSKANTPKGPFAASWPTGQDTETCWIRLKDLNKITIITNYSQAHSQDLEKGGGLFWKSEKCANDLDSNFHWSWISFRRFVWNLRRNVSESSEIQSFFSPKVGWSPQKKKKKKSSPKFRVIFWPKSEIQRFFLLKIRWSPKKKKKKVFAKIEAAISSNFANSDIWGGAIFHFSHQISLKSTKSMRFCTLHKPMGGGSSFPRPPWLRYWLQYTAVKLQLVVRLPGLCKCTTTLKKLTVAC